MLQLKRRHPAVPVPVPVTVPTEYRCESCSGQAPWRYIIRDRTGGAVDYYPAGPRAERAARRATAMLNGGAARVDPHALPGNRVVELTCYTGAQG